MTSAVILDAPIERHRKHQWLDGEQKRVAAANSIDGHSRIECTCPLCGTVQIITIMSPTFARRTWRLTDGRRLTFEVPCVPVAIAPETPA